MYMKEFEGKKLLVLGGIKTECDIVKTAKAMGAFVIVADYNPNNPASEFADMNIPISATDVDAIVEFCRKEKVDGITTGFVDILLIPYYEACKRLGLPCYITPTMLEMSLNKIQFKERCMEFDIPVPQTYIIGNEIKDSLYDLIMYPVFVKPLDASGSRGAGVCYSKEELDAQFAIALNFSSSKQAIVEDYITGREFLLDYIGVNGEFRLLSMFDRYMSSDRGSAINYSNVSICPSERIDQYYNEIDPKVQKMFKELGFTDGLIFMQGYTDGKMITFYEMGCRLGGSFFNLEKAAVGLDPVEMLVRYSLAGKMLDSIKCVDNRTADFKKIAMVVNYLLKGEDEIVAKIDGIEAVKSMNSFIALIQQRDVGYHIENDTIVDKPILSFFMLAKNRSTLKNDLDYMNKVIQVSNSNGKSLLSEKYTLT